MIFCPRTCNSVATMASNTFYCVCCLSDHEVSENEKAKDAVNFFACDHLLCDDCYDQLLSTTCPTCRVELPRKVLTEEQESNLREYDNELTREMIGEDDDSDFDDDMMFALDDDMDVDDPDHMTFQERRARIAELRERIRILTRATERDRRMNLRFTSTRPRELIGGSWTERARILGTTTSKPEAPLHTTAYMLPTINLSDAATMDVIGWVRRAVLYDEEVNLHLSCWKHVMERESLKEFRKKIQNNSLRLNKNAACAVCIGRMTVTSERVSDCNCRLGLCPRCVEIAKKVFGDRERCMLNH